LKILKLEDIMILLLAKFSLTIAILSSELLVLITMSIGLSRYLSYSSSISWLIFCLGILILKSFKSERFNK
ncbi:hypothetical protein, partial [Staphylococcus pseudintermedius]|uniref:hypothetical protein n=1 Tax=Staphylococcus pseudintermedius TaxID=283734 RepID=UPI001A8EF91F